MKPALFAAAMLAVLPVKAENADFRYLANRIEDEYGVRPLRIPLLGFASFLARPFGVGGLDLAIWENLSYRRIHDGLALREIAADFGSRGWKPMVRVHSPRKEAVHIFAKPEGKHMRLIVLAVDDETVMVHVKMDPRRISWMLGEPRLAAARATGR